MGHYILSTMMSCIITTMVSLVYIVMILLVIAFRYDCFAMLAAVEGSFFLIRSLYKQYVQDLSCAGAERIYNNLSSSNTIFVLLTCLLFFTFFSLIASVLLTISMIVRRFYECMVLATYVHSGLYAATVVIDMVLASYFASDYLTLTEKTDKNLAGNPSNYSPDIMRLGDLIVIFVIMKGFFIHVVNLALILISITTLPDYVVRRAARERTPQHFDYALATVSESTFAADREASAVIVEEPRRTFDTHIALVHEERPPLRRMNSAEGRPQHRRLQATRARRARTNDTPSQANAR